VSFSTLLASDAALVEARLISALKDKTEQPVTHAMRYAARGGKRLRGFLVLEGARMLGVPKDRALSAAAAVEALHAYSLACLFPCP
jgi:farnesyl diphosphate synthase